MPMMTDESRKLSATVQSLGIPRKSLKVTSSVGKDNFFAHVRVNNPEHEKVALDHIDHLTQRGVNVMTMRYNCGHSTLVGLTHAFGTGEHTQLDGKSACINCEGNQ
jgi:hypothetical protein